MRQVWDSVRSALGRPARGGIDLLARLGARGITVTVSPAELDGGYVAQVGGFPGCLGQGETPEEAIEGAIEALLDVVQLRVETEVSDHREDFLEPRRVQVVG